MRSRAFNMLEVKEILETVEKSDQIIMVRLQLRYSDVVEKIEENG